MNSYGLQISDVEELEKVPLEVHLKEQTACEILKRAAGLFANYERENSVVLSDLPLFHVAAPIVEALGAFLWGICRCDESFRVGRSFDYSSVLENS